MKVRARKGFYQNDPRRGTLVPRRRDEEFDLPVDSQEEKREAFELMALIELIDESYVPALATYKIVNDLLLRKADGAMRRYAAGTEAEFNQEVGFRGMLSGHLVPKNESQWQPKDLIRGAVDPNSEPRKMYDAETNQILKEQARRDQSWAAPTPSWRR